MPKDKFDESFIKFINKNFESRDQFFLIISSKKTYKNEYKNIENVHVYLSNFPNNIILKNIVLPVEIIKIFTCYFYYFYNSNKIILHHKELRL